ncbi:MAG: hypothetical protein KAT70_02425, partial [Thermoplasmata archaeon]|nr:hypothetical protein [Thermoplasmata archaeon]
QSLHGEVETCLERDKIKGVERFDKGADELWDRTKGNVGITLPRTEEYLNWRYVENPSVRYHKAAYTLGGRMCGFIVLKQYRGGKITTGNIVDILAEDREVFRALLRYSYEYFQKERIEEVTCWFGHGSSYANIFREEGFVDTKMDRTYFAMRPLDAAWSDRLKGWDKWHMTMGDSDVF